MALENTNVLIVEDDTDLRESITEYLRLSGYRVTGVGIGKALYRAIDEETYHVAVIDLSLPDQSGLVLVDYLHRNTDMGIIILTATDTEESQLAGYQSGADLYLIKPISSSVLESAIARLVKRLNAKENAPVRHEPEHEADCWTLHKDKWLLIPPYGQSISLTAMELRFLTKLATHPDNLATRSELLQEFYDRTDEYTGRALDALVRRLRNKLSKQQDVSSSPIKTVYGEGYCFTELLQIKA